jgi:hypothetical protein
MKDSHDKRREAEVYKEKKRLAESAWHALLASDTVAKWDKFAESAWNAAEAMYAESERRRPHE